MKEKSNIVLFTNNFDIYGGLEKMLLVVYNTYKKAGFQCSVLTIKKPKPNISQLFDIDFTDYNVLGFKTLILFYKRPKAIFSFQRKSTFFLIILNYIFFLKLRIIYSQ